MDGVWHYTTSVEFLDRWQALIAGLLGFFAAILVVWFTLRIERRKADRELDALRKSLAVELRIVTRHALIALNALTTRVKNRTDTTGKDLQNVTTLTKPTIYPAIAAKIGLLGPDAMRVVVMYALLESPREAFTALSNNAAKVAPSQLIKMTEPFLAACENSVPLLQKFKVGDAAYDQLDDTLIKSISSAAVEYKKVSAAINEADKTNEGLEAPKK